MDFDLDSDLEQSKATQSKSAQSNATLEQRNAKQNTTTQSLSRIFEMGQSTRILMWISIWIWSKAKQSNAQQNCFRIWSKAKQRKATQSNAKQSKAKQSKAFPSVPDSKLMSDETNSLVFNLCIPFWFKPFGTPL